MIVETSAGLSFDALSQRLHPAESRIRKLAAATPVHEALTTMRETRQHLAVVTGLGAGPAVVTLADVLGRLFPRREDRVPAPAG